MSIEIRLLMETATPEKKSWLRHWQTRYTRLYINQICFNHDNYVGMEFFCQISG